MADQERAFRLRLEGADELIHDARDSWAELGKSLRKGVFSVNVPLVYRVATLHPSWMEALSVMQKRCGEDAWPERSPLRRLLDDSRRALLEVVTVFGTQEVPGALLSRMEGGDATAWAEALRHTASVDVDRATIFAGELDGLLARDNWTSADGAGIALLLPALDSVLGGWTPPRTRVGEVPYSQVHTLHRIDQLRRRGWQRAAAFVEEKLKGFDSLEHELPALVLLVCVAQESGEVDAQPSNELPPPRAVLAGVSARLFIARPRSDDEWRAAADLARRADMISEPSDKAQLIAATRTNANSLEEAVFRAWAKAR